MWTCRDWCVLAGDELSGPEAAVGVDALDELLEVADGGRVGLAVDGRGVRRAVEADRAGRVTELVERDLAVGDATVADVRERAEPEQQAGRRVVAGGLEGQGGPELGRNGLVLGRNDVGGGGTTGATTH
jgi:hypothetical protein